MLRSKKILIILIAISCLFCLEKERYTTTTEKIELISIHNTYNLTTNPTVSIPVVYDQGDIIIAEINKYRAAAGLGTLTRDEALNAAAATRAMELEEQFSHTRPNGSEWWTVNSDICYGECLSKGYTFDRVTEMWINSSTHKEVLMTADFKTIGIGFYNQYIAIEFGL